MTLEEFKTFGSTLKKRIIAPDDVINIDKGLMVIHAQNLNKYLEKYACKNLEDLQDILYYRYGVFVRVIEDEQ